MKAIIIQKQTHNKHKNPSGLKLYRNFRLGDRQPIDLEDVKVYEQSHRVTKGSNTKQFLGLAIKTKPSGNERL
jgi:hypothetical protein